jgi:hypothetical protein
LSTRRIFHGKARNNQRLFSHKKNHPKNEGLRGIKRKQQIQHLQYFTTKLPLQEKQLQHGPGEAVVLVVYLAARLLKAKRCSSL